MDDINIFLSVYLTNNVESSFNEYPNSKTIFRIFLARQDFEICMYFYYNLYLIYYALRKLYLGK